LIWAENRRENAVLLAITASGKDESLAHCNVVTRRPENLPNGILKTVARSTCPQICRSMRAI
jgi:hypothetical protein